jgi:pimeloyl-ACP methyl ester carboxylesterase
MRRPLALLTAAITIGGLLLAPAASPTTAGADGPSKSQKPKKIERTEVCFTVHVIGDPDDHQVSGTLFHRKNYRGGGTALLLQHGAVSERSVWDPQITGVPSMAEELAGAGFAVFTVDRLGYAKSPYRSGEPMTGWALTVDAYVEMTREMVTDIREGSYEVTDDTCPGGAPAEHTAEKVVLIGQSGGAGLSEYYATKYHDIDGIVPMAHTSQWREADEPSTWGDYFLSEVWLGQLSQGKDYVHIFSVEDGYSQPCEDFLFYLPGARDHVVEEICGRYFGGDQPRLMPSGDVASQWPYMQERIKAEIGNVGPTPALLVFADMDFIATGPDVGRGQPDSITPEIDMWTNGCNCDVEVLWQKDAGHHLFVHDSAPEMIDGVIDWLRRQGL